METVMKPAFVIGYRPKDSNFPPRPLPDIDQLHKLVCDVVDNGADMEASREKFYSLPPKLYDTLEDAQDAIKTLQARTRLFLSRFELLIGLSLPKEFQQILQQQSRRSSDTEPSKDSFPVTAEPAEC